MLGLARSELLLLALELDSVQQHQSVGDQHGPALCPPPLAVRIATSVPRWLSSSEFVCFASAPPRFCSSRCVTGLKHDSSEPSNGEVSAGLIHALGVCAELGVESEAQDEGPQSHQPQQRRPRRHQQTFRGAQTPSTHEPPTSVGGAESLGLLDQIALATAHRH